MKDLAKTYAPLVALLVGFGCYWMWQQVANLREQTRLLAAEKTSLMQVLSNQCGALLESQQAPEDVGESAPQEPADGEDSR